MKKFDIGDLVRCIHPGFLTLFLSEVYDFNNVRDVAPVEYQDCVGEVIALVGKTGLKVWYPQLRGYLILSSFSFEYFNE